MKPTTKVVQIQQRQHLLIGSPYNDQNGPLETYDGEGDDINEIKDIW